MEQRNDTVFLKYFLSCFLIEKVDRFEYKRIKKSKSLNGGLIFARMNSEKRVCSMRRRGNLKRGEIR